jgi:ubiquinone/menaquinone biosynthesis C-methylase UbiE
MANEIDVDAFVDYEATGFDRVAEAYHRCFGPLTGRVAEPLLDAAGAGAGQGLRVLDVATGPGQVAERAAARGASVVGLDLSPGMVGLARRLHPGIELRQGDVHDLQLPDDSFDAVVANFVLPHLADHPRAVAEMARVLVDGGRLALSTWARPQRSAMPGVLFLAVEQAGAPAAEGIPSGPPFYRYSDGAELTALLSGAGLVDVEVTEVAFTWRTPSAEVLWDSLLESTVRASAQIRGQTDTVQQRIHRAFDELVGRHRSPDGDELELPVVVKIGAACKPSGISR